MNYLNIQTGIDGRIIFLPVHDEEKQVKSRKSK